MKRVMWGQQPVIDGLTTGTTPAEIILEYPDTIAKPSVSSLLRIVGHVNGWYDEIAGRGWRSTEASSLILDKKHHHVDLWRPLC